MMDAPLISYVFLALYIVAQSLYSLCFLLDFYLFRLPVNWVDMDEVKDLGPGDYPYIVLLYPVLRELESTMRTTFTSLAKIDYPRDRFQIVAVPNHNDHETIASLRRLQTEFPFIQLLIVPATSDPSWNAIWAEWDRNEHVYWWHRGERAGDRNLPPKKTRQLIYAFYKLAEIWRGREDFLVNYIDADSCPPHDHFLAAAVGIKHYDVLQSQNIAGNLNASMAATWHSADHMAWDGMKYPHLSADGKQPYWVLGKGLFYKASDLLELGGFHPWITIEDPEVGMRFWANGKRLGIIQNPLIEEVPSTIKRGIIQRKRWVCGFFQSLDVPLRELGMTRIQRFRAWTNFLPCLFLWVNAIGFPAGIWALWSYLSSEGILPGWTIWHSIFNLTAYAIFLTAFYRTTWKRTALVLGTRRERLWYMLRINPISLMVWWVIWIIPLWLGYRMYREDSGLVWIPTVKIDANATLVRRQIAVGSLERLRLRANRPPPPPGVSRQRPGGPVTDLPGEVARRAKQSFARTGR